MINIESVSETRGWVIFALNVIEVVILVFIAAHMQRRAKIADTAIQLIRRIARRDGKIDNP